MITEERKKQLCNGLMSELEDGIKRANRYIDREEFDFIWALRTKFEDMINEQVAAEPVFAETDAAAKERAEIVADYKVRYQKYVDDIEDEDELAEKLSTLEMAFANRMETFGYEEDVAHEIFRDEVSVYYEFADDEEDPIIIYDEGVAIRESEIADGCLVSFNVRKQLIERFMWNENCFQPFGRDYLIISPKKS